MTKNGCKEEQGTKDAIHGSSLLGWNVAPFPRQKTKNKNRRQRVVFLVALVGGDGSRGGVLVLGISRSSECRVS